MELGILALLSGILVLGFASQVLAWWTKLPSILFLLLIGLGAGPVSGLLNPDILFGELLFPIVSISVAIILFEGSLTLHFNETREVGSVIKRLVSIGAIVSWLITAVVTRWALNCSWEIAFLFGAITVVTGPTVIIPILRVVRPTASVANVLRWEGIIIDPIGAIFAVLVYEFIIASAGAAAFSHTLLVFSGIVVTGFSLGTFGGQILGVALRKHWLPEYLHNFGALALVIGLFALSNELSEESGLLTVTVMGIWLANMKNVSISDLLDFKESLSLLLISGLFIILAARLELQNFSVLGWGAIIVLLAMQFVARPVSVFISTLGSSLTWKERALISWIAPRGIVAAAVSAIFALHLEKSGIPQAELLVPMTFLVIIVSVFLQSATARWVANMLDLAEPAGHGFLIIGSNDLSLAIANELKKQDLRVLIADNTWEGVRRARMQGLPVYYGNAVSEHADRNLDLIGLTGLLALSWRNNINSLACLKYSSELGAANIYTLASSEEDTGIHDSRHVSMKFGETLFSKEETFKTLNAKLKSGYSIHSTRLSEEFDFLKWKKQHELEAIPLFVINKGEAKVFVAGHEPKTAAGSVLISLAPE